jgi:hypothetical protein
MVLVAMREEKAFILGLETVVWGRELEFSKTQVL